MASTGAVDFFSYQDKARKKTSLLIFLYAIAVLLIILAVYAAVASVFIAGNAKVGNEVTFASFVNLDLFAVVAGATLLIVAGGSVFKISQLSAGGDTVATMLGGQPINPNTRDQDERKILNVVDEMAIASGIPVPRVFILNEEQGINAFAAGFGTRDAVIGVTRGCVTQLTRDELQGVVAHEFSHILNGDMKMNIRLVGVLFGILAITFIGRILLRTRGKKNPLPLLGLALIIIGYVGVIFGNLIKSALSRQREFLADASAVQFTRNPSGLSGALKKIGGFTAGSGLATAGAEQASHMFFANGLTGAWLDLFATHPPIEQRVKRLDPSFDGDFQTVTPQRATQTAPPSAASGLTGATPSRSMAPNEVVASIGAPQLKHLEYVSEMVAALPPVLTGAAGEPFSASALVYSLLLNKDERIRIKQLAIVSEHVGQAIHAETLRLLPAVDEILPKQRLPLAELAVSALKSLSINQYDTFCDTTVHLVEADDQVDLFEYTLQRMIVRRLDPTFRKTPPTVVQYYDLAPLLSSCGKLFSCLAYWGSDDQASAEKAFAAATGTLGARLTMKLLGRAQCSLEAVDEALGMLEQAAPAIQKRILNACATCIGTDGLVTTEEAELLRVVADALNCPVPPFVPGMQ